MTLFKYATIKTPLTPQESDAIIYYDLELGITTGFFITEFYQSLCEIESCRNPVCRFIYLISVNSVFNIWHYSNHKCIPLRNINNVIAALTYDGPQFVEMPHGPAIYNCKNCGIDITYFQKDVLENRCFFCRGYIVNFPPSYSTCIYCGSHTDFHFTTKVSGTEYILDICYDCSENFIFHCSICGNVFPNNSKLFGINKCPESFELNYDTIKNAFLTAVLQQYELVSLVDEYIAETEPVPHYPAVSYTTSEVEHLPPIYGNILDWSFKPEAYSFFTMPDEKKNKLYFGMELEVEMKPGFEKFKSLVASRFMVDVKSVAYLKEDSSLSVTVDGEQNGFEIVSHPASYKWWHENDILWPALSKLTRTCESYTVENTGLHFHIGRDAFLNKFHIAMFCYFLTANRGLTTYVSDRWQRKQAPFLDIFQISPYSVVINGQGCDKHTAVNLNTACAGKQVGKTVEIRTFKGNMRKKTILKCLEYLKAVYDLTEMLTKAAGPGNKDDSMIPRNKLTVSYFREFVNNNAKEYSIFLTTLNKYKEDVALCV